MGTAEHSWIVTGVRRGRLWIGRCVNERTDGDPVYVEFDFDWVEKRHHSHGDVIGWLHTHPNFAAIPSWRDVRTMRACVLCLGKPLICFIKGTDGLRGWLFRDDESWGEELELSALLRTVIVGVEVGRSDIARRAVQRLRGRRKARRR